MNYHWRRVYSIRGKPSELLYNIPHFFPEIHFKNHHQEDWMYLENQFVYIASEAIR